MELEILSQNLKSLGLIDTAKSVIWHRKFFEAGLFEVYIGATEYTINLLQEGNFVIKENSFEAGIITYINIIDENERLSVSIYIEEKGIELYNLTVQENLEGIVAKSKESKRRGWNYVQ